MAASNFKVIIVGGGPVGLVAAHIFSKAGIDFIVLERRQTITPEPGSSLALWPQTMRIMDQLNLSQALEPAMNSLARKLVVTHDGFLFYHNHTFSNVSERHGHGTIMFHRADLLKVFYDSLSEDAKSRIRTYKNVISIATTEHGVSVMCDDGSIEQGSIVIGADGVHSRTRHLMREMALKAGDISIDEENPFKATYVALFGNAPRAAGLQPGDEYESHGSKVTTQLFVGEHKMWFFVYQQLDEPTSQPKRYTEKNEEVFAERWGHLHMTETLRFRDVYAARLGAGLTNLEEGVLTRWSWDRVVLAGDAAHKITPNLGWGFNSGVQDLVVLVNSLRHLLAATGEDGSAGREPSTADLQDVFARYQDHRTSFMKKIADVSGRITRMGAWQNCLMWLLDRYVFPAFGLDEWLSRKQLSKMVATVPILDFLEERHFKSGKIPWVHTVSSTE